MSAVPLHQLVDQHHELQAALEAEQKSSKQLMEEFKAVQGGLKKLDELLNSGEEQIRSQEPKKLQSGQVRLVEEQIKACKEQMDALCQRTKSSDESIKVLNEEIAVQGDAIACRTFESAVHELFNDAFNVIIERYSLKPSDLHVDPSLPLEERQERVNTLAHTVYMQLNDEDSKLLMEKDVRMILEGRADISL